MALSQCLDCDGPVSSRALKCPRCGAPVNAKARTIVGIALASVIFTVLASAAMIATRQSDGTPDRRPATSSRIGFHDNALRLMSHQLIVENGYYKIVGEVENTSNERMDYVNVRFKVYGLDGSRLASPSDATSGLGPRERWRFKTLPILVGEIGHYEFDAFSARTYGGSR